MLTIKVSEPYASQILQCAELIAAATNPHMFFDFRERTDEENDEYLQSLKKSMLDLIVLAKAIRN